MRSTGDKRVKIFKKQNSRNHTENDGSRKYITLASAIQVADNDTVFMCGLMKNETHILPRQLAAAHRLCSEFRTKEDHMRLLMERRIFSGSQSLTEEGLNTLIQRGLMVSHDELIGKIKEKKTDLPAESASIPACAWVSRGVTPRLMENVRSHVRMHKDFSHTPGYIIFDDSRQSGRRDVIFRQFEKLKEEYRADFEYFGQEETDALVGRLVRTLGGGKDLERTVRFALDPETVYGKKIEALTKVGANRNRLLLATVGKRVICTDSDQPRLTVQMHPGWDRLSLSSEYDPSHIQYFNSRDELLQEYLPGNVDLIADHTRILGRSAAVITGDFHASEIDLQADAYFISLLLNRGGRVRVTMSGVYGSSGTATPRHIFFLEGEQREEILAGEEIYRTAACSDVVFRSCEHAAISSSPFFMAGHCGLDNTELLPPFFPVGRSEDAIFAEVLRKTSSGSLIGHLPWALYHEPEEPRMFDTEDLREFKPRAAEIIKLLVTAFFEPAGRIEPAEGLQWLGKHLTDIGNLPAAEFREFVITTYMPYLEFEIMTLQNLLDTYNRQPVYWAEDIQRYIGSIEDYLLNSGQSLCSISDELLKDLVRSYGELLTLWPDIIGTARSMI